MKSPHSHLHFGFFTLIAKRAIWHHAASAFHAITVRFSHSEKSQDFAKPFKREFHVLPNADEKHKEKGGCCNAHNDKNSADCLPFVNFAKHFKHVLKYHGFALMAMVIAGCSQPAQTTQSAVAPLVAPMPAIPTTAPVEIVPRTCTNCPPPVPMTHVGITGTPSKSPNVASYNLWACTNLATKVWTLLEHSNSLSFVVSSTNYPQEFFRVQALSSNGTCLPL